MAKKKKRAKKKRTAKRSSRPRSGPAFAKYMARKRAEARAKRGGSSKKKRAKKSSTRRTTAKRKSSKRTLARSSSGGRTVLARLSRVERDVGMLKSDNQRHYEFALGLTNIVRRNYGEAQVRSLPGYSPLIRETLANKPRALPAPGR